jgi:prevent-host-death family protein
MKIIEKVEAKASLAKYADQVGTEPVVVTVNGMPVAALIALENTDLETISLSTNSEFLALIERSRVRQEAEGGISSEEMRHRLGLK